MDNEQQKSSNQKQTPRSNIPAQYANMKDIKDMMVKLKTLKKQYKELKEKRKEVMDKKKPFRETILQQMVEQQVGDAVFPDMVIELTNKKNQRKPTFDTVREATKISLGETHLNKLNTLIKEMRTSQTVIAEKDEIVLIKTHDERKKRSDIGTKRKMIEPSNPTTDKQPKLRKNRFVPRKQQ